MRYALYSSDVLEFIETKYGITWNRVGLKRVPAAA